MDSSYVMRVAANKWPDQPALVYRDQSLAFADLDRRIDQLAHGLLRRDFGGERIASVLLNEPSAVILYMALARIGAVSVPINTRLTRSEKAWILDDSEASALVVDAEHLDDARALRESCGFDHLVVVHGDRSDASVLHLEDLPDPDHDAEVQVDTPDSHPETILYTSGTTGFPKGVLRSHGANLWNAANSALGSPRQREDVELFTLPIFGIGFVHFAMPAFLAGATVALDRAFDPVRTWELLASLPATRTFLAPTMVDAMLAVPDHEQYDLSSLDIVYTAYAFPERLRERALARFGDRFVYMYGLTEAQLTAARPGEFQRDPDSAGKAMGLMRVRILDAHGRPVPDGEVGEIAMEGPSTMLGYLGLPDATAESLQDGWVLTGDLGWFDERRNLHFAGRKKEMIKTGGFSVDPREVERVLLQLAPVREAAVIGVPDDQWGEMVVAWAALQPDADPLTADEVRAHCRGTLADYKIPKHVGFLPELPKNPTGKIERGRLRDLWDEEQA